MVGRDGIEPPTPGFSVPSVRFTSRAHATSNVANRAIVRSSLSGHPRWRRVASHRTVQVRGKSGIGGGCGLVIPIERNRRFLTVVSARLRTTHDSQIGRDARPSFEERLGREILQSDGTSMRNDVRDESRLPMRALLDALSLVVACRGNGADVVLAPDFDEGLSVRGAHLVGHLMPDIRSLRPAIRQVLQPSTVPIKLNPNTLAEYFNGQVPNPHNYEVWKIERCVTTAVFEFMQEIASGKIRTRIRRVRNRPVTDWIDIDTLARLLQEGPRL